MTTTVRQAYTFAVSFVRGYVDSTWQIPDASRPELVVLGEDGLVSAHEFDFPRTPGEFIAADFPTVGEAPLTGTDSFLCRASV